MINTILIVEDLPRSQEWVHGASRQAFPHASIHLADSLGAAEQALAQITPDLCLLDLGLPDGNGLTLIETMKRRHPAVTIVISTIFEDDAHLFPALRAGAQGYVLKDLPQDQLADMLLGIDRGQPPLSPSIARRLLSFFSPPVSKQPRENPLTDRETEVLRLIAKGFSVPKVAEQLRISRNTTAGYLKDIYRKLEVNSRAEATLEAARRGLVSTNAS